MQDVIYVAITRHSTVERSHPPRESAERIGRLSAGPAAPLDQFTNLRPAADAHATVSPYLPEGATNKGVIYEPGEVIDTIEKAWADYLAQVDDQLTRLRGALERYDDTELAEGTHTAPATRDTHDPATVRDVARAFSDPEHHSATLFDESGTAYTERAQVDTLIGQVENAEMMVHLVPCEATL